MHSKLGAVATAAVLSATVATVATTGGAVAATPTTTVTHYDWKDAAGYQAKWAAPYGPGEGAPTVANHAITISAAPFTTAADFSVFDHLKYIRTSTDSFAVPQSGSLEFSVEIDAQTPGTQPGRVVHGCYGPPGSYLNVGDPCAAPYTATTIEGQQAGVVLNMISFQTGQLFDWFVSGGHVFALIERLPSLVTGSGNVGLDKAYTQIIKEAPVEGRKHTVSIRYSRGGGQSAVDYYLDNKLFAHVDHVGVPLDKQPGATFSGTYGSLGDGEQLSIDSFVIGHGLFSLIDAFPFQHPDRPDLSVSIPVSERLFGQGAIGTFKNFVVTTKSK